MKSSKMPSKEVLDQVLKYDPNTGEFFWRARPLTMFTQGKTIERPRSAEHACNQWNSRHAGKRASSLKRDGYHYCCVNYQRLLAHRVAWKIMTGEDPIEIDHIDGNRSNNRWSNLRNGTRSDNQRNTSLRTNNRSGHHGVYFSLQRQKWVASIIIGTFDKKEDAVEARKKYEELLGFHPNHGRGAAKNSNPAA